MSAAELSFDAGDMTPADLAEAFSALPEVLGDHLEEAAHDIGLKFGSEAAENAPSDTGDLRSDLVEPMVERVGEVLSRFKPRLRDAAGDRIGGVRIAEDASRPVPEFTRRRKIARRSALLHGLRLWQIRPDADLDDRLADALDHRLNEVAPKIARVTRRVLGRLRPELEADVLGGVLKVVAEHLG